GFPPTVLASWALIFAFMNLLVHANLNWTFGPLRYVVASPVFHRWHHTTEREAQDKNFAGIFPFWDILFGTWYFPKGKLPVEFGVSDPVPEGFLGTLAYPFKKREKPAENGQSEATPASPESDRIVPS